MNGAVLGPVRARRPVAEMDEKRNCRGRCDRGHGTWTRDDCACQQSPTGSERHATGGFHAPVHGMRQPTVGRCALLGCPTASPFVSTTQPAKRCCGKRSKERLQDRTHTQRSSLYACMTTIERSSRAGVSVSAALRPTRTCEWSLPSGSVTSPAASARSTRKQLSLCGRSRQTRYRGSPGHAWSGTRFDASNGVSASDHRSRTPAR